MSSTSTTESTGAKVATSEKPKTGTGESTAKAPTHYELLPQEEASNNGTQATTEEIESGTIPVGNETKKKEKAGGKSQPKKAEAAATKSKPKTAEVAPATPKNPKAEKGANKSKTSKAKAVATKSTQKKTEAAPPAKPEKAAQKKTVSSSKSVAVGNKKVKLASSTYHYYRNWLAEFMRSHGVPSAKFQKSPESYNGHITVLETEKAKGVKALEQWSKQNPDTKELFWDVKK